MPKILLPFVCYVLLLSLLSAERLSAQASGDQQASATTAQAPSLPNYPDSTSGLEHLLKDIMKAQKENDGARAEALLRTLILPNYESWYRDNFDDTVVDLTLPTYSVNANAIPAQLARFFLEVQNQDFQQVQAFRFTKNCDDDANEQMFSTLDHRLKEFPIYEVRFLKGSQFRRLYAFVYAEGGFRFVVPPNFDKPPGASAGGSKANATAEIPKRVRLGGNVAAARLVKRVQPQYPETARGEHLSGTVKMHAIIGKDGSVMDLRVLSGKCSLARASVDAVKQWRYQPVLLSGEPVEVDTEIDVIFSLAR